MQAIIKRTPVNNLKNIIEYLTEDGDWSENREYAAIFSGDLEIYGAVAIISDANKADNTHIYFINYVTHLN